MGNYVSDAMGFNRTLMELKQGKRDERIEHKYVLIVPLWN